jgi:hypothetical protein
MLNPNQNHGTDFLFFHKRAHIPLIANHGQRKRYARSAKMPETFGIGSGSSSS